MRGLLATARRFVAAVWGQLLAGVILFGSMRLYTGSLDPETFGLAMLALTALSLLDGLGSMAFSQVLAHQLKDRADRSSRIGLALGLGRWFALWLALLMAVGLGLGAYWLGGRAAALLAPIAVVFCATEGIRAAGQMVALLERRYPVVSGWQAAEAVVILGLSVLAIHLTGGEPVSLLAGSMGGRIVTTAIMAPLALGSPAHWVADRAAAREAVPRAVGFGWSVAVSAPLGWLGVFADRYVTAGSAGLVAAGLLAALSGSVGRVYATVSSGFTNLYRPDLLDEAAGRKPEHERPLQRWLVQAVAIGLLGIGAFAVLGELFADILVRFETPGVNRGLLMTVIALSQLFVLLTHACDNRLLAHGRSRALVGVQLAVLVAGLPLIGWAASQYGVIGAALGRVANEAMKLAASAVLITSHRWRNKRGAG